MLTMGQNIGAFSVSFTLLSLFHKERASYNTAMSVCLCTPLVTFQFPTISKTNMAVVRTCEVEVTLLRFNVKVLKFRINTNSMDQNA
jgi:hypothetical protein